MFKSKSLTEKQITYIVSLRKQGKSFDDIATAFGKKFGVVKTRKAISKIYKDNEHLFDLDSPKTIPELKKEMMNSVILNGFVELVKTNKFIPILSEFKAETGFTTYQIEKSFGSYDKLEAEARVQFPETFQTIIDEARFTDKALRAFRKDVQAHKRFVVTTAVTGCEVHSEAMQSLETFCKKRNAKLLILACSDPAHTKDRKYDFSLDSKIPFESVVQADTQLNKNLFISTIKLSAKHINPLTGLHRIAQNKGSFIFASPKQDIEHVANKNKKEVPVAVITTGAITKSNYQTTRYLADRTAKIAEEDHKLGAIVVEIKDDQTFFYRPIQFNPETGAFTDLDTQYFPNGKTAKVSAELVQFGDYHVLSTCPDAKRGGINLVNRLKPDFLTVEDFFDGISINPHESKNVVSQAKKFLKNNLTLANELYACKLELDELCRTKAKKVIFKYGNHEDFLKRWLSSAEYASDKINHYEGVCLAKALLEDQQPIEFALKNRYPIENPDKVVFLGVNDSFIVNSIENGAHGHLGSNGKRNPGLKEVRKAYGACNVGHNHSGAVYKDVFRAGTKTRLQLGYNDGPSSWTQSDVVQHRDGSRQLITYINGEFTTFD